MPQVLRLWLTAHTRDEPNASSDNFVRVFSDGSEIATVGRPAPAGYAWSGTGTLNTDLDQLVASELSLGITGRDAWAPRSAIMFAETDDPRFPQYIPIAHRLTPGFFDQKRGWVSQDVGEGVDRWPLTTIQPARVDDPLDTFVVITHVSLFSTSGASSSGAIYFSLYADAGIPALVVSTPLPQMSGVPPGVINGTYLNTIRLWDANPVQTAITNIGVTASQLLAAQFRILSDDAWKPTDLIVFGLNAGRGTGRLLAVSSGSGQNWWISQDPTDSPKAGFGFGAGESISLPILR